MELSVGDRRPPDISLDFSGAAETDSDFTRFDNDGYLAATFGIFEHASQPGFILQHVNVLKRNLTPGVCLTGSRGIRSEILPEDQNFFLSHYISSPIPFSRALLKNRRTGTKLQVTRSLCYVR